MSKPMASSVASTSMMSVMSVSLVKTSSLNPYSTNNNGNEIIMKMIII